MEYYQLLQLDREPFSNSPDPDYFFQSGQHLTCLQKLELALRLKRGLNVVIGDVGTGKTTLCRQLLRTFSNDPDFESHLILDPSFGTAREFIRHIYELICEPAQVSEPSNLQMKELIKQSLFAKGVDQGKTLVLIIDEGQKITAACVEILRELLNYETNTYKLLQIVIFAQLEFEEVMKAHANFTDRINLLHNLEPMNFRDTCQMVQHRLKMAAATARPQSLFTLPAMWAIYRASKGYPRRIIHLCHQSMLAMIIQNRKRAGWALIRSCRKRIGPSSRPVRRLLLIGSLVAVGLLIAMGYAPKFLSRSTRIVSRYTIEMPPPDPVLTMPQGPAANADGSPTAAALPQPAPLPQSAPQQVPSAAPGARTAPSVAEVAGTGAGVSEAQASIPDPSPAVPSPVPAVAHPPDVLGRLVVKPGDTMVGMVQAVYGTHHNRYLRAVIEANTQIPDPNQIDIGQTISFPALRSNPDTGRCPCWWVILDEGPSLPDALRRLVELSSVVRYPLQLISNWSPQSAIRFQVTLKGYFSSQDEALIVTRSLPQEIAAGSDIVSEWPPETIFFSNPTGGGIRHFQTTR